MKMMKRMMVLVLMMLLALGAACAGDEAGWDLAFALVERETGYTRDQVAPGQIVKEGKKWGFSVTINDHPEDEDGLLVFEMDQKGNLLSMEGPEKINLDRQLEMQLKDCFHREDCAWRLAEVCAKWQVKLADVSEAEKDKIWPRYLAVVDRGIIVPPEGALDYSAAVNTAMDAAAARLGWTEDLPRMYVPIITACYMLYGEPVWFVYLETHSRFEEEYESDRAMAKYDRELDEAFSKVGRKPPRRIGIVIDAFTGELKEKPMLDYIPVEFNYLDFLIRTKEAVESITE